MRSTYSITIPSVNEKPGEDTPTRLRRTRPAEKIIMVIFWNKFSILLTEYLPHRTTISDSYYASIIERLRCVILEKCGSRVSVGVLLLHDNVSIYQCNIVQTNIRKADFVEFNDPAYSPDIAPYDPYLFSNLKKAGRGGGFCRNRPNSFGLF